MTKKFMLVVAVLILGALLLSGLSPQPAEASPDWWDTNWQYRMELTFDNTASGENLTNFPVLVHLTSTHSDFWAHINSSIATDDTKDLRFVDADDSTELYFEAEQINYTSKDALIWVKVPQIDAGSTTDFIYTYYGNPAATQSVYHSANDVWDSNFKMVQHLEETSGTQYDSTSNDNDGVNYGAVYDDSGRINGCYAFTDADRIQIEHSSSLDITQNITLETFVYLNDKTDGKIVAKDDTGGGGCYCLHQQGNNLELMLDWGVRYILAIAPIVQMNGFI